METPKRQIIRHEHAIKILELIKYAEVRMEGTRECINGQAGHFFPELTAKWERELEITRKARLRIIKHYHKYLKSMNNGTTN